MPVDSPTALVEEFKKSGEFDRLRRELLAQFRDHDESYAALKARVEEIGRQRLSTDIMLQHMPQEIAQKELMQEVERYPIVERTVADVRIFSDPTFLASVQDSIQKILNDGRGKSSTPKAKENKTDTKVNQNGTKQPVVAVPDVQQSGDDPKSASTVTNVSADSTSPIEPVRLPSNDNTQTSPSQAPAADENASTEAGGLSIPSNGSANAAKSSETPSEPVSIALDPQAKEPVDEKQAADVEMKDV